VLVPQGLGDVTPDDGLRKALDHRCLAHARLADQHRIVLGASRQHRHHALDLGFPPDDRVELVLPSGLRQVAAELVEHHRRRRTAALLRCAGGRRFLALESAKQLQYLITHPVEIGAQLDQHLCCDALALANEPEKDVLGADVGMIDLEGLAQAQLQHLLSPRRERDVPARRLLTVADDLLDLLPHGLQRNTQRLQSLGGHAFALVDEAEQNVFRTDVVMVQHPSLLLGQHHDPAGSIRKPLEHVITPRCAPGCAELTQGPKPVLPL